MSAFVQQALLVAVTGVVSFAGAFAGVRARLAIAERSAQHAHKRIDEHLRDHITGAI